MKQRTTLSLPSKSLTAAQVTGLDMLDLNKLDGEIWTFMSDYKKRTVHEIRHAIVLLGYPLPIVDRRLDAIFAKKWFDRNGERGNDVKYTLKKHVKNPYQKEKAMEEKDSAVPAPVVAQRSVGTMLKGSIAATLADVAAHTAPTSQESFSQSVEPVTLATHHKVEAAPEDKPHAMLSGAPVPSKASENSARLVVNPDDHVRVAIWKVTQDRQAYTLKDLATLLEHIPVGTINYHLRTMAVSMFDVTRVEGSKAFAYTLREGVDMPSDLPAYQPNVQSKPAEVKPEDKPADDKPAEPAAPAAQPEQQIHNEESLMSKPAAPSLFSMTATIRGEAFTLDELRQLKADLAKAGFMKVNFNNKDEKPTFPGIGLNLLQFKATIRGMEFSYDELVELAQQVSTL